MADNVPITAGAGTSIATDDVGGAHYQRVKLVDATDGASGILFPAPAALADATANPTTTFVGSMGHIWNGATWDRLRLAAAAALADATSNPTTAAIGAFPLIYNGATWDRPRGAKVYTTLDLSSATAETTIWTPTAGKKFRLLGAILTGSGASTLTFKDNTAGSTILVARYAAADTIYLNLGPLGILSGAADRVLTVTRGTSVTLVGTVWGTEE